VGVQSTTLEDQLPNYSSTSLITSLDVAGQHQNTFSDNSAT